jgi:hypothetical protein
MISTDPERPGLCIALPRVQTSSSTGKQTIGLLGVICQGKKSNKVCFWDDDDADPIEFPVERIRSIARDFKSAADLAAVGDVCTACHRGENAFIIHPGTNLDIDKKEHPAGWKFKKSESYVRADDWVTPIVVDSPLWPKNEKWSQPEKDALNAVALADGETDCMHCHFEGGEGGGLGRLDHPYYCGDVMRNALDPVKGTMPPKDYLDGTGTWQGKPHAPSKGHRDYFLKACGFTDNAPPVGR